jgi:hypothetical protein
MTPTETALDIIRRLAESPETKETRRRELFIGHLNELFPEYAWQITEYALGAESPVKTVGRKGQEVTTGRIDTRKGALLIEYKTDLSDSAQKVEAEKELRRYVAGTANEEGLNTVSKCVSTDILRWREYTPTVAPDAAKGTVTPEQVMLELRTEYAFSEANVDRFVPTVRRLVFEDVPLVATSKLLVNSFGLASQRYKDFGTALSTAWSRSKKLPQTRLCLKLWSEYLENCFDKNAVPNEETYLDHAYLVILARMLAASSLSTPAEQALSDFPVKALTGEFFSTGVHRVNRFVDEDFFRWIKDESVLAVLQPALRALHDDLQKLDFRSAKKLDLLTELYQEIMPPDRRAEYGEVFTPTWLVKRIIDAIPDCEELGTKVLDPACGTGSFLRAVVEKKLERIDLQRVTVQEALDSVLADICGLDINPISIIIAKTTIMMSLAEMLKHSDKPVEIPIYLCDSLFLPEGLISGRTNEKVEVTFDKAKVRFPTKLFVNGTSDFDEIVENADRLATSLAMKKLTLKDCEEALRKPLDEIAHRLKLTRESENALKSASRSLIVELSRRIRKKRNSVWAFVLRNTYRPSLLKARFDVVVSNPPWLAMSSFPAARYKRQLKKLIENYHLSPPAASRHHMEIATVFAIHCVSHYMVRGASFGFVLPRVVLKGDQHDPLRRSKFKAYSPTRVLEVWDLEKVNPLFGRPACVLLGEDNDVASGFPSDLPCLDFSGNPSSQLAVSRMILKLSILGKKSSFESGDSVVREDESYWRLFRQGADLMPRRAVIVDLVGNKKARILSVQTAKAEKENRNNKAPWNTIDLSGTVEADYIFTTLKSDAILPFVVGDYSYAALPVEKCAGKFKLIDQRTLAIKGHDGARKWFETADKTLDSLGGKTLASWLERKNKLIDQSSAASQHLVLFGAGGTNVCAAVANTTNTEFPFVNDQTLYDWEAPSEDEAWYVCGMLNSQVVNEAIKGHQPTGKFGEQHVHKLPLSLIPRFDANNQKHRELSAESRKVASVAKTVSQQSPRFTDVSKSLASRRRMFVGALQPELQKLNQLAEQIIKEGRSQS